MTDVRFASSDHPAFADATKEHVRDWMIETAWIIAEAKGADRNCSACQTVMRRIDRRQYDGSGCLTHGFAVPRLPDAPDPWRLRASEDKANGGQPAPHSEEVNDADV